MFSVLQLVKYQKFFGDLIFCSPYENSQPVHIILAAMGKKWEVVRLMNGDCLADPQTLKQRA